LQSEVSVAVTAGNLTKLRELLGHGVDLNEPSPSGRPCPLSEAVAALRSPVVKLLLSMGAHPNGVIGEVAAPMTVAALRGRLDIMQMLLNAGACGEVNNGAPLYAVCAGSSGCSVTGARLLISSGVDCNRYPHRCIPPLHVAVKRNKVALARILLKGGADPSRQSNLADTDGHVRGSRPLHLAVHTGSVAMVKMLLKWGADPSLADNQGLTPLHMASQLQRDSLRKMLSAYVSTTGSTPPGLDTHRPAPVCKISLRHNFLAIPFRR